MPGILEDLGIVNNGKLTKNTYSGYIADVRRRLRTGLGILKSPDLGKPTEPISLYELAQIEKQFLFPEFHSIWRERYEKMVSQLNIPGGFGLTAAGVFLIDPVALAKAMGAKETPEVKFPDILFQIQGLPPPDGPPAKPPTIEDVMNDPASVKSVDFFDMYLKDIDPLDPANITNLTNIIMAPPVPMTPAFPDPRLLRYGYTERFAFENKVYNSHRATHGTMLTQAITLLPNTIVEMSSGMGCYSLMKATRETAELTQPKPMSTSVFEIAAQEILLQHQIKLESAIILGQMLGSGAILQALAATPEETGGLGIINTSTTQQGETAGGQQSTASNSSASGGGGGSGVGSSASSSSSLQSTPGSSGGQGLGFAKPPDDVPPPGGQTTQDGFEEDTQQEGSSEFDQSQGQQTSGTPSGFGFGGPGDDVPPGDGEGKSDPYPAETGGGGPAGSPDQNQPFGFGTPPEDVPPPGSDGENNAAGTGYNQSQSSTSEPFPDNYPPDGGSQGQQTYPPGYGDTPPDVGEERPYTPPKAPPQETLGELQGTSPPSAYESNDDDSPADIKEVDIETLYIPEPNTSKYNSDDEDDDVVDSKSSGASFSKNLSKVRRRIKDLIQGGTTCPAEGGYIGGILGPPPDWSSAAPGFATTNATFRGVKEYQASKEWISVIPGARRAIGAGYTSTTQITNIPSDPSNTTQSKATTCTVLPGWLIENILFATEDPGNAADLFIMLDSSSDSKVLGNGFPYPKNQVIGGVGGNKIVPSNGGLGAPPYLGALLDAWVNADPASQNVNPNSVPGDPTKKPKYGDIYLFRDNEKMLRHIGAVVAWNINEGWIGTADLGQGAISKNEQGMAYCKRSTFVGQNGSILVKGEYAQGDENNNRILMGWIDMDVLIKKLLMMPGLYDNRPKPSWLY